MVGPFSTAKTNKTWPLLKTWKGTEMQNWRIEDIFFLFHNFSIGKHLHLRRKVANAICFVIMTGSTGWLQMNYIYMCACSLLIPPQERILGSDGLSWIPNTRLTKIHILLKSWGEAVVILWHQKQDLEFCCHFQSLATRTSAVCLLLPWTLHGWSICPGRLNLETFEVLPLFHFNSTQKIYSFGIALNKFPREF